MGSHQFPGPLREPSLRMSRKDSGNGMKESTEASASSPWKKTWQRGSSTIKMTIGILLWKKPEPTGFMHVFWWDPLPDSVLSMICQVWYEKNKRCRGHGGLWDLLLDLSQQPSQPWIKQKKSWPLATEGMPSTSPPKADKNPGKFVGGTKKSSKKIFKPGSQLQFSKILELNLLKSKWKQPENHPPSSPHTWSWGCLSTWRPPRLPKCHRFCAVLQTLENK